MNGWYMHDIYKFPPSDKITPIFISVHINNEYLIKNNIDYFKKYEPIGCRDINTVSLFNKHNINAYFTGCLTLYFDDVLEKNKSKYLVDINSDCNYIPNINFDKNNFKDYEIIEHDIKSKNIINNIFERLKIAQNLLNKYRKAKLVITTRLHCILPCRAFNTNSIFINKNYDNDPRFSGLKNVINGDNKLHNKININRKHINIIREIFDNMTI